MRGGWICRRRRSSVGKSIAWGSIMILQFVSPRGASRRRRFSPAPRFRRFRLRPSSRPARTRRPSRRSSVSAPGASTFDPRDLRSSRATTSSAMPPASGWTPHEIPADKSQNGVGSELADRNQEQLRAIVIGAPKDSQLGALYASYMDEARLEQLDAAPLKADLDRVDAIKTKAEFARFMADTPRRFRRDAVRSRHRPRSGQSGDQHRCSSAAAGMGLPDRDYYLLDKYKPQRDAYRAYVQRTLELIGDCRTPRPRRTGSSRSRPRSPSCRWPVADLRDIDKINNPMTLAQLAGLCAAASTGATISADAKSTSPKHDRRRQYGDQGARRALRQDAARDAEDVAAVQGRRPGVQLSCPSASSTASSNSPRP